VDVDAGTLVVRHSIFVDSLVTVAEQDKAESWELKAYLNGHMVCNNNLFSLPFGLLLRFLVDLVRFLVRRRKRMFRAKHAVKLVHYLGLDATT
jgi:hypothetical protein